MPNWKRNAGDRYVNVSNGPINITSTFFVFVHDLLRRHTNGVQVSNQYIQHEFRSQSAHSLLHAHATCASAKIVFKCARNWARRSNANNKRMAHTVLKWTINLHPPLYILPMLSLSVCLCERAKMLHSQQPFQSIGYYYWVLACVNMYYNRSSTVFRLWFFFFCSFFIAIPSLYESEWDE